MIAWFARNSVAANLLMLTIMVATGVDTWAVGASVYNVVTDGNLAYTPVGATAQAAGQLVSEAGESLQEYSARTGYAMMQSDNPQVKADGAALAMLGGMAGRALGKYVAPVVDQGSMAEGLGRYFVAGTADSFEAGYQQGGLGTALSESAQHAFTDWNVKTAYDGFSTGDWEKGFDGIAATAGLATGVVQTGRTVFTRAPASLSPTAVPALEAELPLTTGSSTLTGTPGGFTNLRLNPSTQLQAGFVGMGPRPTTGGNPKSEIIAANTPYSSRTWRDYLEQTYGEANVTSTTVPPSTAPNVSRAGGRSPSGTAMDYRGYPIFDDSAIYDTRVSGTASYIDQMKLASLDLAEKIRTGRVNPGQFNTAQLNQINAGAPKIDGLVWHHHQDTGRMQLLPSGPGSPHFSTGHIGGGAMTEGR